MVYRELGLNVIALNTVTTKSLITNDKTIPILNYLYSIHQSEKLFSCSESNPMIYLEIKLSLILK